MTQPASEFPIGIINAFPEAEIRKLFPEKQSCRKSLLI